jgi:MoaA/NifB/PqqE/SkfB family radical SAM enzyme
MRNEQIEAYDGPRDFSDKAFHSLCYAPFTSLYFDTSGNVRACCHNTAYLLGNISEQSIDEIWRGPKLEALRQSLSEYDVSFGCGFCGDQIDNGYAQPSPRRWDRFPVSSAAPEWPQQFEFSMTNTCNLECIMCGGLWSSAIRAHREKLPPLPMPYRDRFFDQLQVYLPHIQRMRFLGGEPFLSEAYYRIWGAMIEGGHRVACHVTTNGTQYNKRVEHVLDHVDLGIAISMDGVRKETVETIRKNAKYESLMENFHRFRLYTSSRKTSFGLTYCLMRQNWREFGDFCKFAEDWGLLVTINTVTRPQECSLFTLSTSDLAEVVKEMEAQAAQYEGLKINRKVWFGELDRLRRRIAADAANLLPILS